MVLIREEIPRKGATEILVMPRCRFYYGGCNNKPAIWHHALTYLLQSVQERARIMTF